MEVSWAFLTLPSKSGNFFIQFLSKAAWSATSLISPEFVFYYSVIEEINIENSDKFISKYIIQSTLAIYDRLQYKN